MEDWRELVSWTYSGINYSLAGNGGPECAAMVPGSQKIAETVFVAVMSFLEVWLTYPQLKLPNPLPLCSDQLPDGAFGRRFLLVIMCMTFGIELGFKFASRQMIWILNPCHIVTMMQVSKMFQSKLNLGSFCTLPVSKNLCSEVQAYFIRIFLSNFV